MKAKMPRGSKMAEAADYLCQRCETRFTFGSGELFCPTCGNRDRNDLVPVYMEDAAEEEQFYSRDDFGQGD